MGFAESVSLAWHLNDEALFHDDDPQIIAPANSSLGRQLRSAALLVEEDRDVLLDALAPFVRLRRDAGLLRMLMGTSITAARHEMTGLLARTPHPGDPDPQPGPPPSPAPPPPPS